MESEVSGDLNTIGFAGENEVWLFASRSLWADECQFLELGLEPRIESGPQQLERLRP